MELPISIVTRVEAKAPADVDKLLAGKCTFTWVRGETQNMIYIPKTSIADADVEFKETELFLALKGIFDKFPGIEGLYLV